MKTAAEFDPRQRRVGRALVRRRRAKVLDGDPHVACVEVRAPEGAVVVLLVGERMRACSCDGTSPHARCGHAWAAILARDRFLSRRRDGRADPEDDVEGVAGEHVA